MPAQPPFLIPTRRPTTGVLAASVSSRTRAAAASVRVITCRRNSRDAIVRISVGRAPPGRSRIYSIGSGGLTGRLAFTPFREKRLTQGEPYLGTAHESKRRVRRPRRRG